MSSQRVRGGSAAKSKGRSAPRAAGGRGAVGGRGYALAKPKNDIYVGLLGVALGSLLLGCLFLVLYLAKHEFKKAAANPPAISAMV